MEIIFQAMVIIMGLALILAFGTIAFFTIKDYFEERKH